MRLRGTCALAALFRGNNSESQSRPGLTSSRGSTLIFEQRTLATLESFFVLLLQLPCSVCLLLLIIQGSAQPNKAHGKPSQAERMWHAAWLRCGASVCVCVWRINFRSGFCQISKKISYSVKQNKNEAEKHKQQDGRTGRRGKICGVRVKWQTFFSPRSCQRNEAALLSHTVPPPPLHSSCYCQSSQVTGVFATHL